VGGSGGGGAVGSVAQQNVDLRRRLDEEQAAYKRKLAAYQEGQQRQAQLVQKLQAKVSIYMYTQPLSLPVEPSLNPLV